MQSKIIALGFFDGVHLGHQALLRECVRLAAATGCTPAALTFAAHPDTFVLGQAPGLINTLPDRVRLLTRFGAAEVLTLPFDERVRSTPYPAFFRRLREEFGAAGLVCGYDFRFGAGGAGDAARLAALCREAGMACSVVARESLDGVTVSSSRVRALLAAGDVENANRYLGHAHRLSGTVVDGRHLGRTIGIPTANLAFPPELLAPKFGVYATRCHFAGGQYAGVTNIGRRPTVGGHHVTVETWMPDFSGDLYGQTLTLEFRFFVREEMRFENLAALREQIRRDAKICCQT